MKKKIMSLACMLLLVPAAVYAMPIPADLQGTRSTSDGAITAQDGWSGEEINGVKQNNGFELRWEITPEGSLFRYNYTISGEGGSELGKALSHWILEVTDPSLSVDFLEVSPGLSDGPKKFTSSGSTGSNPDMPASGIYGIKWDTSGGPKTYNVSFLTEKDPVWGDFYAKDGVENLGGGIKINAVAWNTGFGQTPSGDYTNWIARPNGGKDPEIPPIPEPATMLLFGTGLAGLAGARLRKTKKK